MANNNLFSDFEAVSSKQWKQQIQYELKGADYNETLTLFKNGHPQVNRAFWLEFYKQDMARLKKYNRIYFCPQCRKFEMYFEPDDD